MSSLRRDLFERRLWLVLVVLLAAIVAVPLLLIKSAPAAGSAAATPAAPAFAVTSAGPSASAGGSVAATTVPAKTLEASLPRDPFASGEPKLAAKPQSETTSTSSGSSNTPASSSTSTTSSSTTPAPAAMVSPSPATASSSTTASTPSTTTTTPATTPTSTIATVPSTTPTATQSWTVYSVAVRYGKDTSTPVRTDLPRLAPLPSVTAPQVMFMGVMAGGQQAVFALGSGLGHTGPGLCRPDHAQCSAIVLRAGQTEVITIPTRSGGHRKMLLKLVHISSTVTHSHSVALAAYQRHSAAGKCELALSDPVSYSAAAGTLSSVAKADCDGEPGAVPFPSPAG